jgi:1,4-alpha-glucan branching enzyme
MKNPGGPKSRSRHKIISVISGAPHGGSGFPNAPTPPAWTTILKEHGIRFSFLDSHGVLFSKPRPRYGVFAPIYSPGGVAFFGRDMETAHQVWSAEQGYPGDFNYREFYRDIGYDLDYNYVRPYLHDDGVRRNTGIKYHRVTGRVALADKEPYVPSRARSTAASHAGNFLFNRERQVEYLRGVMNRPPLVTSVYDAELFGHWWFEGPDFLDALLRKMHFDQNAVKTTHPAEYLQNFPEHQIAEPEPSSWGDKGYHEVWLNASNDWVYPHLHIAAERMIYLANIHPQRPGDFIRRYLNQAARELLLAQSSDWAFLMTVGHRAPIFRKTDPGPHRSFFGAFSPNPGKPHGRGGCVAHLESIDNLFPLIDYRAYQSVGGA